jgi:hypothetical protein
MSTNKQIIHMKMNYLELKGKVGLKTFVLLILCFIGFQGKSQIISNAIYKGEDPGFKTLINPLEYQGLDFEPKGIPLFTHLFSMHSDAFIASNTSNKALHEFSFEKEMKNGAANMFFTSEDGFQKTFFNNTFIAQGLNQFESLQINIMYNHNVVVYINGKEILNDTAALSLQYKTSAEGAFFTKSETLLASDWLLPGINVITVKADQSVSEKKDFKFSLFLKSIQPQTGL